MWGTGRASGRGTLAPALVDSPAIRLDNPIRHAQRFLVPMHYAIEQRVASDFGHLHFSSSGQLNLDIEIRNTSPDRAVRWARRMVRG